MNLNTKIDRLKNVLVSLVLVCSLFLSLASAYGQENPSGVIVETMNSGGYTYALLEKNGEKKWVAVPEMAIGVGDEIEFTAGMDMGQYTSKTLGKTFDRIIFSGGVVAHIKAKKKIEKPEEVQVVAKASGDGAYTISELYEKKSTLVGKKVLVRGKVYKVSKFNGVTWIRIKDGTGSRKKGNHKLVITSQETAKKDDVVTISGVLAVDKKIGGLSYDVVVEKATVFKQ